MDYCTPHQPRRHNPIDSICRKLQTIQWRGEREPHSPFQIPKLSSSSYDSPQSSLRQNLEAILKKGSLYRDEVERGKEMGMGMPTSSASRKNSLRPALPLSTTSGCKPNVTYTITSSLGERGGADGTDFRQVKPWQKCSSTPSSQQKDSPYFTLTQGLHSAEEENQRPSRDSPQYHTFTPDTTDSVDSELPYPALVVKRLSLGDGGSPLALDPKQENMAEVSLICEENLLDTIFHACDTQRRGKVCVSHIVDYLRHTTSRSSGDSGLDELCNMLDPEQKDVSIDLETYHAVMREWIDDCRNNGDDPSVTQDLLKPQDSLSARRSMLLNMTSGSLEAFGGEASRAEFETSELVYCVADLQMSKQKLQDEVRKLKLVVESMEESNLNLAEENEELRNQARISQQLAQKEKMLTDEVEEMKATLSCTEEGRARASAHSKNVEKENQGLIAKIASLQEENFKVVMETDELQKRIKELCDINTDLQVQIDSFDAVVLEKEAAISEKSRQVDELQSAVEEYSSITELLRVHKNKLENQIQMILPDLAGVTLPWSVAYRLNQGNSGSLQTELALAQSPLEPSPAGDHVASTMSFVSPLDETLDKEVLLMLQGPTPEQMSMEFKTLLNKLKMDFTAETSSVMSTVTHLLDDHTQPVDTVDTSLQTVQAELDARRADWVLSLDQLAQYTESLEKELIKMASNMRRSRTEILHLSVRVQEQENQKRQLCDELEQLKTPQDSREASSQTAAPEDEPGDDLDWDEEFALQDFLKNELAERNSQARGGSRDGKPEESADKREEEDGEERWTVVDTAEEPEARDTSTPLSAEVRPGQDRGRDDSAACPEPETVTSSQPLQGDVLSSTHTQAVSSGYPEADALSDLTHSENSTEAPAVCESVKTDLCDSAQTSHSPLDQDQLNTPVKPPPAAADMVSPNGASPGLDETSTSRESTQKTNDGRKTETLNQGDPDRAAGDMIRSKSISQDLSADRSAAEDSTSLLPVVQEEEECVQDIASDNPLVEACVAATDRLASSGPASSSDGASPQAGSFLTNVIQLGSGMTSDPGQSEVSEAKKDSDLRGKNKRELELSRNMEAVQECKDQEKQSDGSMANDKETEMASLSESGDFKGDKNSLSATDKEIETEFQRLALGFKCDMFTLEKRLRLEERSRDLAEENVRREVSSCQGLLQALIPLCEDDNQSMEIIQRLQKNLDILIQSMTRVSSRSEMLGAIHQESRIGKAVEVMIQHVENLRRLYTKEHAELLELREALMQNERSFGSQTERDDFRGKKQTSSQYYKSSARRVSIAAIPRSGVGNMHFDLTKPQDCSETEAERLTRRSPWNVAGKSAARPPLKRFVSSAAWVETEEPSVMMKGTACNTTDNQAEDEQEEESVESERRRSSLSELGSKLTSLILPFKTSQDELFVMLPSPSSSTTSSDPGMTHSLSHSLTSSRVAAAAAVARGGRGVWLWLAIVVVLAGLLALLASLVMQPAVDAAPVGTGDSWITIQQLLWPYAGLRHNAQPPV